MYLFLQLQFDCISHASVKNKKSKKIECHPDPPNSVRVGAAADPIKNYKMITEVINYNNYRSLFKRYLMFDQLLTYYYCILYLLIY